MSTIRYRYPKTDPQRRPAGWWYVGWVLYANHMTLVKAFAAFGGGSLALWSAGRLLGLESLVWAGYGLAGCGALLLINCLVGVTRLYGPAARSYVRSLLDLGRVREPLQVADLHIGTYRISALLADLLPAAQVVSVDLWDAERYETERALVVLRALESPPAGLARVRTVRATDESIPLADGSCDVVVLGMGLHEVPAGQPLRAIFAEARRILRPGGRCLLFEHTVDLQSLLVLGFDIAHLTPRAEWTRLLAETFGGEVLHRRHSAAVDLFSATKALGG